MSLKDLWLSVTHTHAGLASRKLDIVAGSGGTVTTVDDGAIVTVTVGASGGSAHTILSATHTDTTAAVVARGNMMAATSNAAWKAFPTPGADASTSDRFLGTVNGDPHWRPRFYGVDAMTSATGSNALTGQVDIRAGAGIALAVTSNTITISDIVAVPPPAQAVVTEVTAGQSPAVGSALAYARGDHTHGTPAAGGGTTHNLLSATHPDTVAAAVQRGDMVAASSNASWKRQATPAADAFTSDRYLGTLNGDPHWKPRFYGLDGMTSSTSNSLTGVIDLRVNSLLGVSLASNTITLTTPTGGPGAASYNMAGFAGQSNMAARSDHAHPAQSLLDDAPAPVTLERIRKVGDRWSRYEVGLDSNSMGQVALGVGSNAPDWTLTRSGTNSAALGTSHLLDLNGSRLRLPNGTVGTTNAANGVLRTVGEPIVDSARFFMTINDGGMTGDRPATPVGWMPYALFPGNTITDNPSSSTALPAVGGSVAIPVFLSAPMRLVSLSIVNNDTATARSWEWRMYEDRTLDRATLNQVTGATGSESFTPGAASTRTAATASIVVLPPGAYWLVIRNTHATSTFSIGRVSAVALWAPNNSQTKTLPSALGTTLDFTAATWTKSSIMPTGRLNGTAFSTVNQF